ncbi:MAG: 2-phospho-L-lactate transferase [Thermoprotei archaeon]|nr:MAG: 2-phospho-L-lactate transferase [Thermoprotei archaeon]
MRVTALAGGVGAARFLRGLVHVVPPENITVIGNVGDDLEVHGLYVSPDLDILMYTLAGIVDEEKGWGVKGDTFNCLSMLSRYGCETWFKLGDLDLATHIYRTLLLRKGFKLSEVTRILCEKLGVRVRIIPVTDSPLRTVILSDKGELQFQEYFVKLKFDVKVTGVRFAGVEEAEPAEGVLEALEEADAVIVCPSNPVVSIGPILAVKGVREALRKTGKPVVAVSPIIGGRAVKGPADRLMRDLGFKPSALGVAELYRDFLKVFVIDLQDARLKPSIEALGIRVEVTGTLMKSLEDSVRLAEETLKAALKR